MFDIHKPSLIRNIFTGLKELVTGSVRPLRRKPVRRRIVRDFVLVYPVFVLWLHFIGYRSWYPEFHLVREGVPRAAIESIPLAILAAILSYFWMLWDRNWL